MGHLTTSWQVWALLAAGFAAATAILAKLGVSGIAPDYATFLRTLVVLAMLVAILVGTGQMRSPLGIPARPALFLVLSGLATGASWLCYFRALSLGQASQVAPIDKLSVVLVAVFGTAFLGERLSGVNWLGIALIAAGAWLVARQG